MKDKPLHLDWCSHQAAEAAVKTWHYSHSMPAGRMVRVGVWEYGQFKGVILFSRGANKHIGMPYGLDQYSCCELTRVALTNHEAPVTRMIAIAIKMLRKLCPEMKMIVSYADTNQGHHGGIYQGGNWVYTGEFAQEMGVVLGGKMVHRRSVNGKYGTSDLVWLREHVDKDVKVLSGTPKYKYVMPLTNDMKSLAEKIRKPYPESVGNKGNASEAGDPPKVA